MAIIKEIAAWNDEFTRIRRDLHAHPELAYEEVRTSDIVAEQLQSWGIETHRGLAKTGVVGVIHGDRDSGRALGLRADMDALPMPEANHFAHASVNEGKMHGCGHDGHTTMLLAASRYLASHRDFAGTVNLIFQPAEEDRPGAERMVKEGLFQQFPMEAVFGMHNRPGLPAGIIAVRSGAVMASCCWFSIKILGRGGHAARPDDVSDPIMAATQVVQALQTIVSRNCAPTERLVISVTQIHGGSADNVIPDSVEIRGTVRSFSRAVQDMVFKRMAEISDHVAAALGCRSSFTIVNDYPLTYNDPAQTKICDEVVVTNFGEDQIKRDLTPQMGGEDFAFLLQEKPGCYVMIGNGDGSHRAPEHGDGPCLLHNTSYDFNDAIIPTGASYWVHLANRWLAQP